MTRRPTPPLTIPPGSTTADFWAYRQEHKYIYIPTRKLWPAVSIDAVVPSVTVGQATLKASVWLDRNRAVEQLTWSPGDEQIIKGRYITNGGWIDHDGATVFNLYLPPELPTDGDPAKAQRWVDHLSLLYPDTAGDMIWWFASRVQHPNIKINHALVMGGDPGIGKDTILEPVRRAVGYWNTQTISPPAMLGRFNAFLESVILVVAEARDMGEFNRYQFYEHTKAILAAPPETLMVDQKNVQEYAIPNLVGVVYTTNHKNSLALPADDRRHLVCWSDAKQGQFPRNFWTEFWEWYERGGFSHVAAYLKTYDLTMFDAKAPPTKTQAFWDMVNATRPAEAAEIADTLDEMAWPKVVYPSLIIQKTNNDELRVWMTDRKTRHLLGRRLEDCGYEIVPNPDTQDRLWKIDGKRQTLYGLKRLTKSEQMAAAERIILGL